LGFGSAITRIDFSDIVVGTPASSNFDPPKGVCLNTGPGDNEDKPQIDLSKVLSWKPQPRVPMDRKMEKLDRLHFLSKTLDSHIELEKASLRKKHSLQQPNYPPNLNQQFAGTWTLNASVSLTPPFTAYMLKGELAFDFVNFGLAVSLTEITGNIPLDLQFEFRIYPWKNGIEWLQVGPNGKDCYAYIFLQWIFTFLIPQFQLPIDSIPMDPAKVNGDLCSVWQTTYEWYGDSPSILYIRQSDNTLVQMTLPEPFLGFGMATLTLSNVQDVVPPSRYSRPDTCVNTMTWNPSWQSHLPWDWCDPYC
jgi:hypothetical protein